MKPFLFSCDSHINEPKSLWLDGLPAGLRDRALQNKKDERYFYVVGNGRELLRMQIGDGVSGNEKIGRYEIAPRIIDMERRRSRRRGHLPDHGSVDEQAGGQRTGGRPPARSTTTGA